MSLNYLRREDTRRHTNVTCSFGFFSSVYHELYSTDVLSLYPESVVSWLKMDQQPGGRATQWSEYWSPCPMSRERPSTTS